MKGILLATLIWFAFDCCTTLGSLYARAYLPHADPNESCFLFAFSVLPEGLRGLFILIALFLGGLFVLVEARAGETAGIGYTYGDPAVAEAFLATRYDGRWGGAYGTLPTGLDVAPILDRALASHR